MSSSRANYTYNGGPAKATLPEDPSNEVLTPTWLVDRIRHDLFDGAIDLDPASNYSNPTNAGKVYTIAENGLENAWFGHVFCNPPYGKGGPLFAAKAIEQKASAIIVMLLSVRTNTKWQQELFHHCDHILFFKRRVFVGSPFDSMLVSFNVALWPLLDLGIIMTPHWIG